MRISTYIVRTPLVALLILLGIVTLGSGLTESAVCYAQGVAQTPPQPGRAVQPLGDPFFAGPLVEPREDYRLGPGDVINVQIERAPELSGMYRVNAKGSIKLDYLGSLMVKEKTQDELSSLIADGLRGRYLKNPHVSVEVKQINSHAFFIQGAVNRPGVYMMEGRPSLLKLITVAGGLADNCSSTGFIIREVTQSSEGALPPGENRGEQLATPERVEARRLEASAVSSSPEDQERYELREVNISGLFKGRFDQNTFLEPGTIVNIPRVDVFFVAGEVHAPGSFPLKEGTTVRQAITLAQGTTFKAAGSRAIIFREDLATGKRQEIKVDIGRVMAGKEEDVAIRSNDIIIVPNSRFKSVGGALLSAFGVNSARLPSRFAY